MGDTSNSSRVWFLKFLGTWTSKLMINEIQKAHWKSIRRGWLGNSEIQLIYYHLAKCAFGALSITYLSCFLQHMYTYWFGCLSREVTFQQYYFHEQRILKTQSAGSLASRSSNSDPSPSAIWIHLHALTSVLELLLNLPLQCCKQKPRFPKATSVSQDCIRNWDLTSN